MEHRVARTLAVLIACAAFASPALGQSDDFRKKEAEERYKEGLALHDKGREDEARVKFEQAYAALKRPNILFSLARSEQLTSRPVEAITHYRMYLADPLAKDTKFRNLATEHIVALYKEVGRVEIKAPDGVKVSLDGEALTDAALREPIIVKPGTHKLLGQSGEKRFEKPVSVAAGESVSVAVVFDSSPPPPPPPTASASTTTPPPPASASSAPYTYTPPPRDEPSKPGFGRWIGPIALGVAGAAGVGAGVVFGLKSSSAVDDANAIASSNPKNLCANRDAPACRDLTQRSDDASKFRTFSYVGYVAGGALMAGAAVWATLNVLSTRGDASSSSGGVRVVPLVGNDGAGASFTKSF